MINVFRAAGVGAAARDDAAAKSGNPPNPRDS
jgi:hypothetical protein